MDCLSKIFKKKDGVLSLPIGAAAENFFVSYAAVAETKTESLQLLKIFRERGFCCDFYESLHFSARFPYSAAFGTFCMLVVRKINNHRLCFKDMQEKAEYASLFDFASRMVGDSEIVFYESGERLLKIGWSEGLQMDLKQVAEAVNSLR